MMAETITLRAYLNDLKGMVENESPTEVVSHCRYILQHYPQNVATYRLLGRALLQKGHNEGLPEHFVQAADIFQRVLSVTPDDPVAHLALSEIREQEGAVDQAIWHLERAQEQMPGQTAVEEALRNLYDRRSGQQGVTTGKLQLSHSALARQYANSELYDEAVLELRRVLHAEPERVDLQVLLAKLLWESQHRVEAGEVAVEVLKRLPYCLEANALMARLWLAYGRPSDAQQYLDRVEALDPYAAASILRPDGDAPDPNSLPRLDYTARAAASLSTETPEWVHDLDDIDDFGAAAGAAAFGGEAPVDQIDTAAVFGEQAEPADWVQGLFAAEEDATPDWFSGADSAPEPERAPSEPAPASWLDEADEGPVSPDVPEPDLSALLGDDVPDWFGAAAEADTGEATSAEWEPDTPDARSLFDLLEEDQPLEPQPSDFFAGVEDAPEASAEQPFVADFETEPAEPDWFAGLGEAVGGEQVPDEDQALDPLSWLEEEAEPEAGAPVAGMPDEAAETDRTPLASELDSPPQDASAFPPEDEIAELDRLFEALSAAEAQDSGEVAPAPEEDVLNAEPPHAPSDDWLAMFQEEDPSAADAGAPVSEVDTPPAETDAPPWDFVTGEPPLAEAEPAEESPFSSVEPDADPFEVAADEETSLDNIWDAIGGMSDAAAFDAVEEAELDAEEPAPPEAEEPEISTAELFGGTPAAVDDDLLAALSQSSGDDDDWLRQFDAEAETAPAPFDEVAKPDAPPAGQDDWLRDIETEADQLSALQGEDAAPLDEAPAPDAPPAEQDDWLREIEAEADQLPTLQDADATPETLSDDDIQAIFGEPAESAPPEAFAPSSEDMGAEFTEFEWPESEAAAPDTGQVTGEALPWAVDESAAGEPEPLEPAAEPAPEDWLGALSEEDEASDEVSAFAAEDEATAEDDGAPEEPTPADRPSLFGLARAVEQAQPQDVPDWMAGLEVTDSELEDEALGVSPDDVYDPFEGGDPANVPSYESAGHTGVLQPDEEPDWMLAFESQPEVEAASAVEGEEEDEVPDFMAADLVDDEPEDVLAPFDAPAETPEESPREPAPTQTFDGIEWDMPGDDLILGAEPEQRAEADADIPDWLSAITQAASPDEEELAPDAEDLFATGDAQAVPDWLREIEGPAPEDAQDAPGEEAEPDTFAPAADLADTRDASPALIEDVDEFDDTFSFTDREPTWLRRASQRPGDEYEDD